MKLSVCRECDDADEEKTLLWVKEERVVKKIVKGLKSMYRVKEGERSWEKS